MPKILQCCQMVGSCTSGLFHIAIKGGYAISKLIDLGLGGVGSESVGLATYFSWNSAVPWVWEIFDENISK